ncbi:MAG: hypothetical protein F4234_01985 [Gammaproteobacteria bacterium]|nr:methylenetetrahydrofolate reductase C-terminal domain-containing protein [Gammaproteobacteria bacterium]MXY89925.1 hypothetical protein [Gammaproteobacteria bacterium]MXZ32267.1 hypothetical protein [Gammaproteobacteria bacterium]MYE98950.1 hypothetical protein [Gammaproteobacteria bacterium]MYG97002.1 hypothetical protein [Gammaproteobacteria bacterium]
MYRMRLWSVRHAHSLKRMYAVLERGLVFCEPLLRRIGYRRLDAPFARVESLTKGFLLDSQNCGQCIVGFTGLSCPMNCPKKMRNGPCGGVRADGACEVDPRMQCVWVLAWDGARRLDDEQVPLQAVQPPVDHQLIGRSAWLREVRIKVGSSGHAI